MAYTSLRSDYETFLRERNKNLAGVSEWERLFLQPLTQQTEAKVTAAQESAQYDISQAYANYKRNQMRLLQQNIDTGAQQQLSSGLQSAYNTAYSQRQQQLSSELEDIGQEYQTALTENQQQIQNVASRLKEFTNLTLEKAGLRAMSQAELAKLGYLKDVGDGYEITNKLRNLYQQQLYGSDTDQQTLEDYIRQTSNLEGEKLETLIDDLYKYQNILNETMGLAPEQRTVNKYLQAAGADYSTAPKNTVSNPTKTEDVKALATEVTDYARSLGLTDEDLGFNLNTKLSQLSNEADRYSNALISWSGKYIKSEAEARKAGISSSEYRKFVYGTYDSSRGWTYSNKRHKRTKNEIRELKFQSDYDELIRQINDAARQKGAQYK